MFTFAERAKATQQTTSLRPPMGSLERVEGSCGVNPIPGRQRTIGNQAVLRLSAANREDFQRSPTAAKSPRVGDDFSRIPTSISSGTPGSKSEQSKSSAGPSDPGLEVTQPPTTTPAGPPDAGAVPVDDPAAAAKKASLKSGPAYSPSGTIKATKSGSLKIATFKQSAEFENDPTKGVDPSCGEIRQYIKWSKGEAPPNTGAFEPKSSFSEDTWYEDRDPNGKRYGHRSGTFAECVSINHYEDKKGVKDCAKGEVYAGQDDPKGAATRTGMWSFELRAVDTCGGTEKVIGTPASVAVDFNV